MDQAPRLGFEHKLVIGMVHLQALPGSPGWSGAWASVLDRALEDAMVLAEEGMDAILVENYGDTPFYPDRVPPVTVSAMTRIVCRLMETVRPNIHWGINVLRNDAEAALGIAAAAGASFIRVNIHTGATVTDQGILQGQAYKTLRLRSLLAPSVRIFADARVKHGSSLHPVPLADEVSDLIHRGRADAVLITGRQTGECPSVNDVSEAARTAGKTPVLVASGVREENVREFLGLSHGVIVGTALKRGHQTDGPIDRERVRGLLRAAREVRS